MIDFASEDERTAWDQFASCIFATALKSTPASGDTTLATTMAAMATAQFADAMLEERRKRRLVRPRPPALPTPEPLTVSR